MTAWRVTVAALLAVVVGLPLALPLGQLLAPAARPDGTTLARIGFLAANTMQLVFGTLLVAVPAGVLLALLLERTDLPGRVVPRGLLWVPLFVPLPLFTSGWQAVLGADGFWPTGFWSAGEYAPWSMGIGSAVWIHALAGLPWVVLIVRHGLSAVEPELEEDALLVRPAAWVLLHVTLRRSLAAVAAACVWVALMTAGEISVADLMQVRTFAEEVNTQLVSPQRDPDGGDPLGRAVAVSLAWVGLSVAAILLLTRSADRLVPAGVVGYRPALRLSLGVGRWPICLALLSVLLTAAIVPIAGLAYRAGVSGPQRAWSIGELGFQLRRSLAVERGLLVRSLFGAAVTGILTTGLAVLACWLARGSAWFRAGLLGLGAVAWAMPGPVVGLGQKELFRHILDITDPISRIPAHFLWYGPSSVPVVLVHIVRMFPFAIAILWPVVRLIPRELFELGRLDGLRPLREWTSIVWPATWRGCILAALAVAVLSLGEISAGKIVSTPEAETFAEVVWTQMHYGVGPDLAAKCLVLLAVVFAGASLVALARAYLGRGVSG